MNTIFFLIFIGACAVAVVWAARTSKAKTDLARKSKTASAKPTRAKLATPPDNRLAHSDQLWERRKKRASMGGGDQPNYVPRSEAPSAPLYDGYSRRDRHHLTPKGAVKEEDHIEDRHGLTMTSIKFKSSDPATRT